MSDFKAKMHQRKVQFFCWHCATGPLGELTVLPYLLAGIKGPSSKGKEREGCREGGGERDGKGQEGGDRKRGRRREGRGRGRKEGEGETRHTNPNLLPAPLCALRVRVMVALMTVVVMKQGCRKGL